MRFRTVSLSLSVIRSGTVFVPRVILTACLFGALIGCQQQGEITQYTVKRLPPFEGKASTARPASSQRPQMPPGHAATEPQRLLGAIAPHERVIWVFKLAGSKQVVADQMEKFLSFVQSLNFTDSENPTPKWTLPEGWTERADQESTSTRFATLTVKAGDEELPLTITRLPFPQGRPIDGVPLMIVNLWCEQLGLPEKKESDLSAEEQPSEAEIRQLEVAGTKITLANFVSADRPTSRPTVAARGTPKWTVPETWTEAPGNEFSIAAFSVTDGSKSVKTTVSQAGGDLLQNLNRWRGQLGLEPWSAGEMAKGSKQLPVDGGSGTFVELVGTDARTGKPSCTLGVILPRGDSSWFFKLTGDVELAQREKSNFEAFVQSVKFE